MQDTTNHQPQRKCVVIRAGDGIWRFFSLLKLQTVLFCDFLTFVVVAVVGLTKRPPIHSWICGSTQRGTLLNVAAVAVAS
jgi:hypothetical protein